MLLGLCLMSSNIEPRQPCVAVQLLILRTAVFATPSIYSLPHLYCLINFLASLSQYRIRQNNGHSGLIDMHIVRFAFIHDLRRRKSPAKDLSVVVSQSRSVIVLKNPAKTFYLLPAEGCQVDIVQIRRGSKNNEEVNRGAYIIVSIVVLIAVKYCSCRSK